MQSILSTPFSASHMSLRMVKASPSDVGRNNRALVFGMFFPFDELSRTELEVRTGLSRVAISGVLKDLLSKGLICESGHVPKTGKGKRSVLLKIDTTRPRIIMVDLSQEHLVQGVVTNLVGIVQYRTEFAVEPGKHIDMDIIIRLVDRLYDYFGADDDAIGICVVTTGVVRDGVVRESTVLRVHDFDLLSPLEQRFGIPVTICHDVTSALLAERFFGTAGPNVLFVMIERGIGAATLIEDVPVIGENYAAGEIGHIPVDDEHGRLCTCGKRGCLETIVTATAMRERMRGASPQQCSDVLRDSGRCLADALAMLIGLLDMSDICVYGPPDIVNGTFLSAAQSRINALTVSKFHTRTVIRRCKLGVDLAVRGAAISAIQHYFDAE